MDVELNEHERIDKLMQCGLEIIQSPTVFSFSLDALLLGDFAVVPKHNRAKIVDLCSGNGVLPLLLSKKTASNITGIELQEKLVNMARRSFLLNKMETQLEVIEGDVSDSFKWFQKDSVDVVTCNPPYFPHTDTSIKNPNEHLAIARHELHTNLEEIVSIAGGLLKVNGKMYLVHRPDRFLEIIETLKRHRLTPKKIQFVYPKKEKDANIVLIEAIKDGKDSGFKVLPPLVVFDRNNEYSQEARDIVYGKN